MHPSDNKPYRLMAFKEFIPETLRFWIYIAFAIIFQFSGGVYMSLANEMTGSLSLIREEVLFAGYATLAAMAVMFPFLFPLKFRFTNRSILLTSALVLIGCNLIAMHSRSLPVLVIVSFLAGIFRMWGFFECLSTIQLKITPSRDFARFFPVVFTLILGSIQLSGITSELLAYWFTWEYYHVFVIGLLLFIVVCSYFLMWNFRPMPPQPLDKIDWLGATLWYLFLMQLIFILVFGAYYDWLDSVYIRIASIGAMLTLMLNIWRARHFLHPHLDLHAFKQRNVVAILILFGAINILLATPLILQSAFTGNILHYDVLQTAWLNWPVLAGILAGGIFTYLGLAKLELGYKFMVSIGLVCIVGYIVMMYFLISPDIARNYLILPLFLRGAGNVITYITITTYAARTIPFMFFFQTLSIFGFVSTALGTPLGSAIVGHAFSVSMQRNMMINTPVLDYQNQLVMQTPLPELVDSVVRQSLLISVKEIFGYFALAGTIILILSMMTRYKNYMKLKMPRWE